MSEGPATPNRLRPFCSCAREHRIRGIYGVVRHHQIDFASGALVFPGGKADPQDFDDALIPYLRGAEQDTDMRAAQVTLSARPLRNAVFYWPENRQRQLNQR